MTLEGRSCQHCGVMDTPRVAPGSGPHGSKAVCAHCGAFIKWLPKTKEERMQASVNRVILLGEISKEGVEMRYNDRGTARASFMLVLSEVGNDGKTYQNWFPCEVWGKSAEKAGELESGDTVLFEGKLRRQKRGETWETVASGLDVTPLRPPKTTPQ